jgi:hypothetical protein
MARMKGAQENKAGMFARIIYGMARRRLGKLPEPMTVVANHPKLFKGYVAFEWALDRSRRVEGKLKSLAQVKVATLVGCPF